LNAGPPVGGGTYGGLPQILTGGSSGAVASNTGVTNTSGGGGGAIAIVANGAISLAGAWSANGSSGNGGSNGGAGGGAGGALLFSAGNGLSTSGTYSATGGASAFFDGNSTGGGGGRIMLGGIPAYFLGGSGFAGSPNVNGGAGLENFAPGNGLAGTITVDAFATTVPNGWTVPLNGSPIFSVGGGTQTAPYIEAFVRHDLTVSSGATATLQANDALRRLNASGANITSLTVDGTFDLNGYDQTVNNFSSASSSSSANVKLTNGSVLTVGVSNFFSSNYFGQVTGTGGLVKVGTGTLTLNGTSTFTGPTAIAGGTLTIANDLALQSSTVTPAGGTVTFASPAANPVIGGLAGTGTLNLAGMSSLTVGGNNASTTFAGGLFGSAAFNKVGNGTLTFSGFSDLTAPTTITGGTLAVANDTAFQLSTVTMPGGGSLLFAPGAVNPVFGGLAASVPLFPGTINSLTIGGNGDSTTYSGVTQGPLNLIKKGSGTFTIANDQSLSPVTLTISGGNVNFTSPAANPFVGAVAGTGGLSVAGLNSLMVGGFNASATYTGNITGSMPGGLIKIGSGTWTLASGNNNAFGPFNIQSGTVVIGSTGALPNVPVTVQPGAVLDLNGFNVGLNSLTMSGLLRLGGAGVTPTGSNPSVTYTGTVTNGVLRGGPHTVQGGILSGIVTFPASVVNVTANFSTLSNYTNGGTLSVAGGLTNGVTFNGFTNQGSGTINLAAGSKVQALDFESYGTINLTPGTSSAPTQLTGGFTAPLFFNGGSRTFIGTPQTARQNLALVDLHGQNAVVAGGLFVNNGFVGDSTGNGATIIADYGALVKGAGTFQSAVITQNGGKFQAGNSPGISRAESLILGPGGTSAFNWQINNAIGAAGPTPDANHRVSGWSLLSVEKLVDPFTGQLSSGDLNWTATGVAGTQFNISLQTLINPITVGQGTLGAMANFNNLQPFAWKFVSWQGNYTGPTDDAALTATVLFDASNFVNPIDPAGKFSLHYNGAAKEINVVYAVPEPGTMASSGLAAIGWVAYWRRRWGGEGESGRPNSLPN
jgi:fibronectin-binding autotransporter adhesin